jgi:AraC-like DNA-binding protein
LDRAHDGRPERVSADRASIALQAPLLQAIAARFCRDMSAGSIDALKFETLALAAVRGIGIPGAKIERVSRIAPLSRREMRAIALHVSEHLGSAITLEALASVAATSPFHFAKRFKETTGTSPYAYVIGQRMIRAMQLLRSGRWTVTRVARAVGYRDPRHFRRQFTAQWNQMPGDLDS